MRLITPNRSLKVSILGPMLFFLLVSAIVYGYLNERYLNERREQEAVVRAEIIADAVQYAVEFSNDAAALNRIVYAMRMEKGVESILVVSDRLTIISSTRYILRNKTLDEVQHGELLKEMVREVSHDTFGSQHKVHIMGKTIFYALNFLVPTLVNPGTLTNATVLVEISTDVEANLIRNQVNKLTLLLLVIVGSVSLLTYLLLSRFVFKPLDHLQSAIQIRKKGKEIPVIRPERKDEIGMLGEVLLELIVIEENAKQSLLESQQMLELVIQATRDGIWDWPDMSEDHEYWSPQWKALLGYDEKEIEARASTFFSMLHPDDLERVESAIKEHTDNQTPFNVQFRLQQKSGDYRWFRSNGVISIHPKTGKQRMTGALSDIQLQKDYEEKILNYAKDLEKSNKELDEFAYIASHDLRAPLRGVQQVSQWIKEDLNNYPNSAGLIEHIDLIQGRVKRMQKLLTDLLSYSQIGDERSNQEIVNLQHLIREAFLFNDPPVEFQLELSVALDVKTYAVPLALIFRNLFDNAIKHHHKNRGNIVVTGRFLEDQEGYFEFSVQDDGPGIHPDHHEKIFQMFKSLQPRDKVEGSGMGLAFVEKLVNRYSGTVSIRSVPGNGSTFVFTWPVRKVQDGKVQTTKSCNITF